MIVRLSLSEIREDIIRVSMEDLYFAFGDFGGEVKVFDDTPIKLLFVGIRLHRFAPEKLEGRILDL